MQKQLRAIFILAGTAVGSGMISLPIVLAPMGLIPSILLMLSCAFITYVSALIRTELNLHSDSRFTLELVGLEFSGKGAAFIGNISLRLLQFSLLAAYIYGLSALLGGGTCLVKLAVALGIFVVLAFSSNRIIKINQRLFLALVVVICTAVGAMLLKIDFGALQHLSSTIALPQFCVILPTLFTSFGFQGSLHSLTKFCENDQKLIKTACLWGSLLPAALYIAWVVGAIVLICNTQPELFGKMVTQGVEVNELIQALRAVADARVVKSAIFIISILAIATSLIGVGLALVDDLDIAIESACKRLYKTAQQQLTEKTKRTVSAAISVIFAVIVAIFVPNAFIKVLGFAGMILSVIAIFLPTFLLFKLKNPVKFGLLRQKWAIGLCFLFGVAIVLCEIVNIFSH